MAPKNRPTLYYVVMCFALFLMTSQSLGQSDSSANDPISSNLTDTATWNGFLTSSEQAVGREGIDDIEFERITQNASNLEDEARELIGSQSPLLDRLEQQLAELGPEPKEGEPAEAPAIEKQRKFLQDEIAKIDGQIKDARLTIVRAQQLKSTIISKRRDRFLRSISTKSENLINLNFWGKFLNGFDGFGRSFQLLIKDSFNVALSRISEKVFEFILMIVFLGIVGLAYTVLRRRTKQLLDHPQSQNLPPPSQKAIRAAVDFTYHGILNAGLVYAIYHIVHRFRFASDKLNDFMWSVVVAMMIIIVTFCLGRIFLSPKNKMTRIAQISDSAAQDVSSIGKVSLALIALLYVLNESALMLVSPFEVSVGLSAILTIVAIAALVRSLLIVSRDRIAKAPTANDTFNFVSWLYIRPLLWLAAFVASVALAFSYTALAEYVSFQIVIGLILFGVLYLTLDLIDAMKLAVLGSESNAQKISQSVGIQSGRVKQLSVLGFGLVKTAVLIAVAMAMLLPWGFRTSQWLDWINEAFFGFQVGGLTISISTIVLVVVLFLVGYAVTRAVQAWLSNQFLPTTSIDIGLRNSISTILGYIGIVLAVMLAVSAAGFDMSNLAIVAGALSVGVGFGLQSIVNNFVSGLILLAERPIKSGDWIITSGGEGTVRKISVRSTEIETFERATIIVPNSNLITESVTNWTHSSKFGRVNIVIGVAYDSDPDQVSQLLLRCFQDHEGILNYPEPSVFLTDFGADALTFDIRGFLSNIENGFGVKSELRFAILRALREANIEIPFPQRDTFLKANWDEVAAAFGSSAANRADHPLETKENSNKSK